MSDGTEQQQSRAVESLAVVPTQGEPPVAKPPVAVRRAYGSDLTDEQWALVWEQLPPAPGGGRPRTVNLREVVNAIFYRLRTGCAWEMLPHDFPPRSTPTRSRRQVLQNQSPLLVRQVRPIRPPSCDLRRRGSWFWSQWFCDFLLLLRSV